MTNTRWKVLACVVTTGSLIVITPSLGAEKPRREKAKADQETLLRVQKSILDEQREAACHVADLEKEVQALRADVRSLLTELHALRAAQEPQAVVEAKPAGPAVIEALDPIVSTDGAKKPSTEPGVFRLDNFDSEGGDLLLVVSPEGDRIVLSNSKTGVTKPLKLSGDKAHPHQVHPGSDFVALKPLAIEGPKITRLAVLSLEVNRDGSSSAYTWYSIDLREPVDSAVPGRSDESTAIYHLGDRVYAFSRPARRWDVLKLPRDASPTHGESNDGPTIENDGHIYTFVKSTGLWKDLDVRAILDPPDKKLGDPGQ